MERMIRCTTCTWRGPWEVAESAPRLRAAAPLAPSDEVIQAAYAEQQEVSATIGGPVMPPCPMCGNHVRQVKLHSYRAVG
jgi:hypothetical protein